MAAKVLLVDDDIYMQRLYQRTFQQAHYDMSIANDGVALVDRAKVEMPDVIIMDVMMPRRNGMEALGDLMGDEVAKNIPVIMLSANEDDQLMLEALQLGAKRYLVKSMIEPEQMIQIATEVIAELSDQAK